MKASRNSVIEVPRLLSINAYKIPLPTKSILFLFNRDSLTDAFGKASRRSGKLDSLGFTMIHDPSPKNLIEQIVKKLVEWKHGIVPDYLRKVC